MKRARADEGRGLVEIELEPVTNSKNKASPPATQAQPRRRNPYRDAAVETLLILRQRFPAVFAYLNAPARRPLKVGIHVDHRQPPCRKSTPIAIRRALRVYCTGRAYRENCVAGAVRIDLDGKPAGIVAACEAAARKRAP